MPLSAPDTLVISPYKVAAGEIIAAASYLIDRFVPACEIIALPEKEVAGGHLTFSVAPTRSASERPSGLRQRLLGQGKSVRRMPNLFCDMRLRTPENWAHFLNNHLPLFFAACDHVGLNWSEVTLVVPAGVPNHILAAAEIFGLHVQATDDTLEGEALCIRAEPWTGIRSVRAEWVAQERIQACLHRLPRETRIPDRVFVSRRNTRTISNTADVEAALAARGFVTIYPEDLTPGDQMRLFHEAREIVGIHGAALAPLLYRRPGRRLERIIEILPCGHMTDVYRVMADQVGVDWIGVRGRIKPEYISPAYDMNGRFDRFSLDSFEVDIQALNLAFERG